MSKRYFFISLSLFGLFSCSIQDMTPPEVIIPEQSAQVQEMLSKYNEGIAAYQYIAEGNANVVEMSEEGNIILDNGVELCTTTNSEADEDIPVFGIDSDGFWIYSLNGEVQNLTDASGNEIPALSISGRGVFTPQLGITEDGFWQFTVNGYQWEKLSDVMVPSLNDKDMSSYSFFKSSSLNNGNLNLTSIVGETVVNLQLPEDNTAEAWRRFIMNTDDNVLLDFSYAGYMHGEVAPPDVNIDFSRKQTDSKGNIYYNANIIGGAQGSAIYKVYNIADYGANGNDELSDRHALVKILKDALGATEQSADENKTLRYYIGGDNANAVIYFPEGKYILRGGDENETVETLRLTMGNIIFKGAGRDKTVIEMAVKNNPVNPSEMWSSPNMLEFKHNSGLTDLCDVTGNAKKGTFSVKVSSTSGIKPGDWVCLSLKNNDPELIAEELAPHKVDATWTELVNNGVQIQDYHQVKLVSSTTLTFYEPIMREVDAKWGWKIQKYPHYQNIGIEDLKFLGHSKEDFKHHGSADDDGGFKPIQIIRQVNSWLRRVDFESVSEAHSFVSCANVSAYDVEISGNRGHSAIRSQASSRVFIGKVYDHSNGKIATDSGGQNLGDYMEGAGQYHGCGISKQSMGAVIWNVRWGDDSCFESHATQPRATLIDNCQGGFVPWREGGDINQLPNHLNDLTIWNMNATVVAYDKGWNNTWIWWDENNKWWKNLPPIIVGWSGQPITFDTSAKQIKYHESLTSPVYPNSLYEAQLKRRLGYVPTWLNALK